MNDATVYVVDDDRALRESLGYLLQSEGLTVRTFEGARQFLQSTIAMHEAASWSTCACRR